MDPEDVKDIFKTNLKKLRQDKGWSHHTLSKKSGLSIASLRSCEWEGRFSAKTIAPLCRAFDIDPWVLFLEED